MRYATRAEIIEEINRRVDPRVLLERIGYHPESIRELGTILKCFCPIHKDEKFPTLLVDKGKRTFKCAVRACEANRGGNLIEFFALFEGQPPTLQTAFRLMKFTDAPTDDEFLRDLCAHFITEGRQAIEEGRNEEAAEIVINAMEVDPNSIEAHLLAARLAQARGAVGEALEHAQRSASLAEATGNVQQAIEITRDTLLQLLPEDEEILLHLADLYEAAGQPPEALGILDRVIETRKARGDYATIIPLLERSLGHQPDRLEARRTLAESYKEVGEPAAAAPHYLYLADLHEQRGEKAALLEALREVRQIDITHWEARERLANLLLEQGDSAGFMSEMGEMALLALDRGQDARAESYYRRILAVDEESFTGREGLVRVLQARGDLDAAAAESLSLATLCEARGLNAQALDWLRAARSVKPEDSPIRERLIEALLQYGQTHEALEEILDLARLRLAHESPEAAAPLLERVANLAGTDLEIRLQVIALYAGSGQTPRALAECARLSAGLQAEQRLEDALRACETGLEIDSSHLELRRARAELLRTLGRAPLAVEEYADLASRYLEREERAEAEAALAAALALAPERADLKRRLADSMLESGRDAEALQAYRELAPLLKNAGERNALIDTCLIILGLDAEDQETRERLAMAYLDQGRSAEAAEQYGQIAARWRERGDAETARVYYDQALELAPDSLALLRDCSQLLASTDSFEAAWPYYRQIFGLLREQGDAAAVKAEYQAVLEAHPNEVEVRQEFADWLFEQGETETAYEQSLQIAQALEDREDTLGAAEILRRLVERDPERVEFLLRLSALLETQGLEGEAAELKLRAAEIHIREKEYTEAAALLEDVIRLAPEMEETRERLAALLVDLGQTAEAIARLVALADFRRARDREPENIPLYRRILELDPARDETRRRLAQTLEAEGLPAEAAEQWLALAERLEAEGRLDDAAAICRHVSDSDPEDPRPRLLLTRLCEAMGDSATLKQELDGLVAIYLSQGQTAEAEAALRRMREIDPADLTLPERLGRALEEQGRSDEACDLYHETALRHREQKEEAMARALLLRVKSARPERLDSRRLLAGICEALGDTRSAALEHMDLVRIALDAQDAGQARTEADQVVRLAGTHWDIYFDLARILEERQQSEEAVDRLRAGAQTAFAQGETEYGLRLCGEALRISPLSRPARELRIEFLRREGRTQEAAAEFRVLAEQSREADSEAAVLYYQSLLDLEPDDIEARRAMAELMLSVGEKEEALREFSNVAERLTAAGDSAAAIEAASRALEVEPGLDEMRLRRARLLLSTGDSQGAAADFSALANAAIAREDWEAAEKSLREILALTPDSLEITRRLAEVVLRRRPLEESRPLLLRRLELATIQLPFGEADAEYAAVLELDPQNAEIHVQRARFLRDHKREKEAAAAFRQAIALRESEEEYSTAADWLGELCALSPGDFRLLTWKAELFLKAKQEEEARAVFIEAGEGLLEQQNLAEGVGALLRALEIRPDDEALLERVASLYEESGSTDPAVELYRRLANLRESKEDYEGAFEALHKILRAKPDLLEDRRRLAQLYEDRVEAENAAQQWLILAEKTEAAGDLEAAASICQHIKEIDPAFRENRSRLIRYHKAAGRIEPAKQEISELADLCEALGETAEVQALLAEAMELDPEDRSFARRMADFWMQQGEAQKAVEALARLAAACARQGDLEDAIAVNREILAIRPEDIEIRRSIVELLAECGRQDEASVESLEMAESLLASGDKAATMDWLRRGVELAPGAVDRQLRAALILHKREENEEARRWLLEFARAQAKAGKHKAAIALLNQALEWFPGEIEALEFRLECETSLDDTESAVATLKTLARRIEETGDVTRLEALWNRGLELAPLDVELHEGLIAALEREGDSRRDATIQALLRLADLHQEGDRAKKAVECLRRCLAFAPERHSIRERMAQSLLALGDWPNALEEYFILAQNFLAAGEKARAREYFEKALELDSENIDALRTLIALVREQNDHEAHLAYCRRLAAIFTQVSALDDAIQCHQEMVEFTPGHTEGWEALGLLLEQAERKEEAFQVWDRLATQYEEMGDGIAALEKVQKMASLRPHAVAPALRLAQLSASAHDPAAAQRFHHAFRLADEAGDWKSAIEACRQWSELAPGEPLPHREMARALTALGRRPEAADALRLAANLHEERKEFQEAAGALADLLDIAPERHEERERFARLLRETGETERSIAQTLLLADAYHAEGDTARAIERCREILELDADRLEAHERLFSLHESREDFPPALAEVHWLTDHYLAANDLEKAREFLESGLRLDPQNIHLLEKLARLHLDAGALDEATNQYLRIAEASLVRGDVTRAVRSMESARDCCPDDVEIRRNLAEIYVRQGDHARARREFFEVARLYLAQGLVADARGNLDALIIQTPKDTELRERIANLYLDHGIPELATLQFIELARLKREEGDAEAVGLYAMRALEIKPRSVEAKELLVEAMLRLGDEPGAYQAYSDLAELYSQAAQLEKAIAALEAMILLQPRSPEPRQRLIEIFRRANRPDAAMESMRELAALFQEAGELDKAVSVYRAILEVRPDDTRARMAYIETYSQFGPEQDLVTDYLKLAEIHRRHGEIPQAIAAYEKALQIEPDNTEYAEAFIRFLLEAQQIERAEALADALSEKYVAMEQSRKAVELLTHTLSKIRENTKLRLRLAECHNRLNARGMALRELRVVAQANRRLNDQEALARTLHLILEIDPQNVETRLELIALLESLGKTREVIEQRTQMADVYMSRGLLDLARDEYRAITRLEPGNLTAWRCLIESRQQLGETDQMAEDYVSLARALEEAGDVAEALDTYQKVFEIQPNHIEARRRYIEAFRQTGPESELVDHYLILADALVAINQIDEAIAIYSQVMTIDPVNETARKKLADTQARRAGMVPATPPPAPALPLIAPASPPRPATPPPAVTEPAQTLLPSADDLLAQAFGEIEGEALHTAPTPAPVPFGEAEDFLSAVPTAAAPEEPLVELQEEEAGLEQVVANYLDILQVNPQNANVRIKLADIYGQLGRKAEMIEELSKASEIFFQKSELNMCVTVCERILALEPANALVRERLSKAVLKRDAFKALESAILFSDQAPAGDEDSHRKKT